MDPIFFGPKIFWAQNFLDKNFVGHKSFCFLLIIKTFSVIYIWIYSPLNNLTFAKPYLEQTFTWNSSVAQLSLACSFFKMTFLGPHSIEKSSSSINNYDSVVAYPKYQSSGAGGTRSLPATCCVFSEFLGGSGQKDKIGA